MLRSKNLKANTSKERKEESKTITKPTSIDTFKKEEEEKLIKFKRYIILFHNLIYTI